MGGSQLQTILSFIGNSKYLLPDLFYYLSSQLLYNATIWQTRPIYSRFLQRDPHCLFKHTSASFILRDVLKRKKHLVRATALFSSEVTHFYRHCNTTTATGTWIIWAIDLDWKSSRSISKNKDPLILSVTFNAFWQIQIGSLLRHHKIKRFGRYL